MNKEHLKTLVDCAVMIAVANPHRTGPFGAAYDILNLMEVSEKEKEQMMDQIHKELWSRRELLPFNIRSPKE